MIRRLPLAAALLLLAGCGQAGTPTVASSAEAVPSPVGGGPGPLAQPPAETPEGAANAPETLAGKWRVAAIDGKPLDAPIGLAVSIDEKTIRFEPVCVGFSWNYDYDDGQLKTWRSSEGPQPVPGSTPPPVCAVAVYPEQRALGMAIRAATHAVRTPANAVELSGGGHSVTLFSQ